MADGFTRIEMLRASVGTVHNCVALEQLPDTHERVEWVRIGMDGVRADAMQR
jgi:hypothetical protein